jgi:hypothetical protein
MRASAVTVLRSDAAQDAADDHHQDDGYQNYDDQDRRAHYASFCSCGGLYPFLG